MRTKITLLFLLFCLAFGSKAQTYVTIPDPLFVIYLQSHYPSCMNGNQMDITCAGIQNETNVNVTTGGSSTHITDLTGIQYFINLQYLDCNGNQLTTLPALANTLINIYCQGNQLTSLPSLPDSLRALICDNNQLTSLPPLKGLEALSCGNNQLSFLPALPNGLIYLACNKNFLTSLPAFPSSIQGFYCDSNSISCFPVFPNSINYIGLLGNSFTCLPNYLSSMDSTTLAYPLCVSGDMVNNPNGCFQTVSIDENSINAALSVYPNPGSGNYFVKFSNELNNSELNIEVYNILGELILKNKTKSNLTQIDLSEQPNGIYTVRVNGAKQLFNHRLIKQ